ncbi:MAG: nucleoside-diphosphate kinase [Bacteroidales bacterium]|nr:nucleoside-diphosphate kinase [Bacteroidales bacterium]
MERTLVILKPGTVQRGLIGEVTSRLEKKGLFLVGLKMQWLDDQILSEHYSHLKDKPFFGLLKKAMSSCPVVLMCWEGKDAVSVVRTLIGPTNGRLAPAGTIRGDYSMSTQENIIHASDSTENAEIEINRFFKKEELFDYQFKLIDSIYASDEK